MYVSSAQCLEGIVTSRTKKRGVDRKSSLVSMAVGEFISRVTCIMRFIRYEE